jgi:rod shape-determining protein MreD
MNRNQIIYVIMFILAVILQLTLVKYIEILNWRPDLILIVLVFFSLRFGPNWGMSVGFFLGLIQDLISTHFLGLATLSKTVAGFISGSLAGKFAARTEYLLTLLISGLIHDFVYFFIYTLGENFSIQSLLILYTLPNLMYTIILGAFLNYFLEPYFQEESQ